MASVSSTVKNAPCHVLNIPSELRLKIYQYLYSPVFISFATVVTGDELITRNRSRFRRNIGLLLTSRQIQKEAAAVLHDNTTVELYMVRPTSCGQLLHYRKDFGSYNFLRSVKHIDIKVPKQAYSLELLSTLSGLFRYFDHGTTEQTLKLDVASLSGLRSDQVGKIMYTLRDRKYAGKVALCLSQAQKSDLEEHYEVLKRVLGAQPMLEVLD